MASLVRGMDNEVLAAASGFLCLLATTLVVHATALKRRLSGTHGVHINRHVHADGEECAICLSPLRHPVVRELPCGHRFCTPCILRVEVDLACLCPLCRAPFPGMLNSALARGVQGAMQLLSAMKSAARLALTLPRIALSLPRLIWTSAVSTELRALRALMRLFVVLLLVAYILLPVDFLPELVLGPIGLIDDIVVLVLLIRFVSSRLQSGAT